MTLRLTALLAALLLLAACPGEPETASGEASAAPVPTITGGDEGPAERSAPEPVPEGFTFALEEVVSGLDNPTFVTAPPGDDRLVILEQGGRVRVTDERHVLRDEPLIDVSEDVLAGGERGLLGLAFHPEGERFYVYYTSDPDGTSRLVEYRLSGDPYRAEPDSRRVLLEVEQPGSVHNAGMVMFGPDGLLYVAIGDGHGPGDPFDNAQDRSNLLGAILRIDVDAAEEGESVEGYGVPRDNPFADGEEGAPEVWAYGLRNPWRFDIDPDRELIYIADVGQYQWESVYVRPLRAAGLNYGWPVLEGSSCYPAEVDCTAEDMELPDLEYQRGEDGCAIIGGFVYRGRALPELTGHYLYSDYCGGWVRGFLYEDGEIVQRHDWSEELAQMELPTSFGMDAHGELYITAQDGVVRRLVPAG